MRSEVWTSTAETLQDNEQWPTERPWEHVMQMTTFGGTQITQEYVFWWFQHVQAPCQHTGSPWSYLQDVEGTKLLPVPDGYNTSMAPASKNRPFKKTRRTPASSSSAPWDKGGWNGKTGKGGNTGKGKGGKTGKDKSSKGESKGKGGKSASKK